MVSSRLWVYAVILLALLVGGVYGYTWYSNNNSNYEPSNETSGVNVQTTPQHVEGRIKNITKPPTEFYGPTFTEEIPELKINVTLSNSSVKIGETLWMKVRLLGKNVYNIKLLRMSVMNSEGQKVYDVYVWLPHRTLTPGTKIPQEVTYYIVWKASKHPSANIEITPGNYIFIIKASVNGKEVIVKGIIKVVK